MSPRPVRAWKITIIVTVHYRINQSTVFKTVLFFCLHSLLPESFAINFPILIQEVVRMLTVLVPSISHSIPILESRHYTSGGSQ